MIIESSNESRKWYGESCRGKVDSLRRPKATIMSSFKDPQESTKLFAVSPHMVITTLKGKFINHI